MWVNLLYLGYIKISSLIKRTHTLCMRGETLVEKKIATIKFSILLSHIKLNMEIKCIQFSMWEKREVFWREVAIRGISDTPWRQQRHKTWWRCSCCVQVAQCPVWRQRGRSFTLHCSPSAAAGIQHNNGDSQSWQQLHKLQQQQQQQHRRIDVASTSSADTEQQHARLAVMASTLCSFSLTGGTGTIRKRQLVAFQKQKQHSYVRHDNSECPVRTFKIKSIHIAAMDVFLWLKHK